MNFSIRSGKQYQAKATFFVVGSRVYQCPDVVLQLVKDGHEIANHTYTHPDIKRISSKELGEEVTKTQELIFASAGIYPQLFRPPGGHYNDSIVKVAKNKGL
ncbi:polysaccharide deacetylase family protein [Brevibacillus sp. H7]|uniref:polysaccharide deacetylase family protein n=1 Tax=Brevibacillus sp. H7 TaxID=3349138 RepID=UPI003819BBD3